MKFILDTDLVLWWLTDDKRLPRLAREIIEDENNEIVVSMASMLEIADRVAGERLKANISEMESSLISEGITILSLTAQHCAHLATLPPTSDFCDRILVAQSQVESVLLLSSDPRLTKFGRSVVTV